MNRFAIFVVLMLVSVTVLGVLIVSSPISTQQVHASTSTQIKYAQILWVHSLYKNAEYCGNVCAPGIYQNLMLQVYGANETLIITVGCQYFQVGDNVTVAITGSTFSVQGNNVQSPSGNWLFFSTKGYC